MERLAPVLLCKLEKIFPPGFFNPMQHMILHLPYEARMGGPVQGRWCYSIERLQKILRNKCKNKCKIEASIAESYILEEVSNYTTKYYANNLTSVHNPPPRYNAGNPEDESKLSIFRGQLGSASGATNKTLQHEEWRTIMLYVLTNLSEVEPYMQEFNEQFWHESREPTLEEASALLRDGVGNDMPDFISWFKQKGTTDESMSADLRQVADGCAYRVRSFKAYDVNGYRFHTASHEQSRPNRRTTNTGVFTPGLDGAEYYGRIEEIYELNFDGSKPLNPVIFKCHWFDPEVVRRTPNLGLVEIRQSTVLPGDDVYIVAQQATQVYYLSYPCKTVQRLKGLDVVYKVPPHGKLPVPNNEDYNIDPNTYDGEFFQEDGLAGIFEIDLTEAQVMEVDNETGSD
ncbi:uncharacterized protein LOC133914685 [Phragmites australis]|uniref:uncharacterized protein LOC133914685 n=1 Tax=Phragmites australis TaxID=29695 RepID=UPI002D783B28|nr:uncharacterized protein LOC133914685 [Phragmites australis]